MKILSVIIAASIALTTSLSAAKASKGEKAGKTQNRVGAIVRQYDVDKNHAIEGDEAQKLKGAFSSNKGLKRLDKDKSGTLDDKEISALNSRLAKHASAAKDGRKGKKGAEAKRAGKGGKGKKARQAGKAGKGGHRVGAIVKRYDTNKNHAIEGGEVQKLKDAFASNTDLKRLDKNKNGALDDKEISALNSRLAKHAAAAKDGKAGKKGTNAKRAGKGGKGRSAVKGGNGNKAGKKAGKNKNK